MASIKANTAEMKKEASRMKTQAESLVTNINELYKSLYRVGDAWKSNENRIYINGLTDYLNDLNELCDSIQNYAIVLDCAAEKYEDTIQENMTESLS
jgi:uncharacterized protein YukE